MNNSTVNPMFAKFDAIAGKTTPTTMAPSVTPRSQEVLDIARKAQQNAPQPSFANRVSGDINTAGKNVHDAITGEGNYAGDEPLTRGFEATGEAFKAPLQVASEALPKFAREGLGKVGEAAGGIVSWLGEKIGSTQLAQDFVTKYPEAARHLEQSSKITGSSGDIAGTILAAEGGAKGAQKSVDVAPKVVEEAGKAATDINNKIVKPTKEMVFGTPEEQALKSANERVTPDYESMTPTQKSKTAAETSANGEPRVVEGGMMKGRVVNQTSTEIDAAKELAKVPGYSEKLSHLETHNLIRDAIKTEATDLRTKLASEKIALPKKEIVSTVKNAVNSASEGSLLLSKSDPMIENYVRVAQKAASESSGNLEGILDTRQALDEAYENARGKMAYGDTRINTLDEIHQSARNALNKMLDDNATSADVKASLKKQSNLYRADDNIIQKIGKEDSSKLIRAVKKTKIGKFAEKHPYITGAAGTVVGDKIIKATTGFGL